MRGGATRGPQGALREVVGTSRQSPRAAARALPLLGCCRPLGAPTLSDEEAEATAQLFRALGDPARVRIVNLLARSDGPVCACEFEPALRLAQPTVSHHLKRLTDAGLLVREQRGKWAYFSLDEGARSDLVRLVELPHPAR